LKTSQPFVKKCQKTAGRRGIFDSHCTYLSMEAVICICASYHNWAGIGMGGLK